MVGAQGFSYALDAEEEGGDDRVAEGWVGGCWEEGFEGFVDCFWVWEAMVAFVLIPFSSFKRMVWWDLSMLRSSRSGMKAVNCLCAPSF